MNEEEGAGEGWKGGGGSLGEEKGRGATTVTSPSRRKGKGCLCMLGRC